MSNPKPKMPLDIFAAYVAFPVGVLLLFLTLLVHGQLGDFIQGLFQ